MVVVRRVEGLSMAPTYRHGSIVVGWRFSKPKVGDVVIVKHHRLEIIKRVGQLKHDQLYLLGDNPNESTDSRQFGWLPLSSVLAVIIGGNSG